MFSRGSGERSELCVRPCESIKFLTATLLKAERDPWVSPASILFTMKACTELETVMGLKIILQQTRSENTPPECARQ